MIRRRRPKPRETFSFDSFLDVVANVVGIIIRLILVVWVGARSYTQLMDKALLPEETAAPLAALEESDEPAFTAMKEERSELQKLEAQLLEQLHLVQDERDIRLKEEPLEKELTSRIGDLHAAAEQAKNAQQQERNATRIAALTTEEIQARSKKLREEIEALQKNPVPKKPLHYRTPVSRPVQSDEFHFELSDGRVTFVDVYGLLAEYNSRREDIERQLQGSYQSVGTLGPSGAFKMVYTVERERGLVDSFGGGRPGSRQGFRYGLVAWQMEAVALERGENVEQALRPGSDFRRIADRLDSLQSAVTFWVYPDSFAAFRKLRDFLYERDITVAGRPMPFGVPMASSKQGTLSRGQ